MNTTVHVTTVLLRTDCVVELAQPPQLTAALAAKVDEIWEREKLAKGDCLTDGRIYSLQEFRDDRLVLQPLSYRHYLARRNAPELAFQGLDIRPVGVTGVLSCGEGVLLGKRAEFVAADANLWELAPSGGLSDPNPVKQLLDELTEEIGLRADQVTQPKVCGLAFDADSGVVDIVFELHTAMSSAEILECHQTRATDEYQQLICLSREDLPGFLEANKASLLPALGPMLRLSGWV